MSQLWPICLQYHGRKIESLDSENHKDWISKCKKNVSYIVRKTDDAACKLLDMVVLETPRETAVYEQVKFVVIRGSASDY